MNTTLKEKIQSSIDSKNPANLGKYKLENESTQPYSLGANRVANINAEIAAQGNKGFSVAPTTITSESLQSVNPYRLPDAPISTLAEGITGQTQAIVEQGKAASQLQRETEDKRLEAETKVEESRNKYLKAFEGIKGIFGSRGQVEQDAGIDKKSQRVTDVTNQLEASQRAQVNEIRALEGQAITEGQRSQIVSEINRKYAFEQADLALIQSAANRDLTTAQSIADRKIELALEPLKMEMEFTKMFYEENREAFDKADQRAFETKMKEDDKKYNEEKSLQETISKLQLSAASQGADPSIVQAIGRAKSADEAIQAAGQYGGDILEREIRKQQLENLKVDYSTKIKEAALLDTNSGILTDKEVSAIDSSSEGKKLKSLGTLKLKLDTYRDLVGEFGTETGKFGASQKNHLDAAYADLKIAYKTAAELGALTGPDVILLEQAVKPATFDSSISRAFSVATGRGAGSITAGLNQANTILNKEAKRNAELLSSKNPRYAGSEYFNTLILPFEDVSNDPLGVTTTATEDNPLGI